MENIIPIILISTIILLIGGIFVISLVFTYQQRKIRNAQEIILLKETFRQTLLQSQLEIQEQTLKKISQEIHDNIGQILSLTKLNLFTMDPSDAVQLQEKIAVSKTLVSKAIIDLRGLSHSLNPDYVEEFGLVRAIEYELEMIKKSGTYHTTLEIVGSPFRFNKEKELIIYRIMQEAFNNIIKHAEATSVFVSMNFDPDNIKILIKDNGIGFDLDHFNEDRDDYGIGIKNMDNRSKVVGSIFSISSWIGKGTEVKIILPTAG